jgi:hypothetical protein
MGYTGNGAQVRALQIYDLVWKDVMAFSKKSALQMLNPEVPLFQDDLVNRAK